MRYRTLFLGFCAVAPVWTNAQPVKLQFSHTTNFPGLANCFVSQAATAPNGAFIIAGSGSVNSVFGTFAASYSRSGTRNWLSRLSGDPLTSNFVDGMAASGTRVFTISTENTGTSSRSLVGVFEMATGSPVVVHPFLSGDNSAGQNFEVGPAGQGATVVTSESSGVLSFKMLRFDPSGDFLTSTGLDSGEDQSTAKRCAFGPDGRFLVSGRRFIVGVVQGLLFNVGRSVGVINNQDAEVATADVAAIPASTDNVTVGQVGSAPFAARLNEGGSIVWRTNIPGVPFLAERVFVDPARNIFACGANNTSTFIVKLNGATGAIMWSRQFPGQSPRFVMDPHGEIYAATNVFPTRFIYKVSGSGAERFRLNNESMAAFCITLHGPSGDVFVGGGEPGKAVLKIFRQAPVAIADGFVSKRDTLYRSPRALTTNDRHFQGATVTLVTPPANGTLTLSTNGIFTYRPNNGFLGQDRWSYKLSKPGLTESTAQVTMTVVN